MNKLTIFFIICLTGFSCTGSPVVEPPVFRDLNPGEPPAKIICAEPRQFVVSDQFFVSKPLEKALRIELAPVNNTLRIIPEDPAALTIHFPLNSCVIDASAMASIDRFMKRLTSDHIRIEITGYTCWLGAQKINEQLARDRADAVADYFKTAGFEIGSVRGRGNCCYLDSLTPDLNRRVEITAISRRKEVPGEN